MNMNNINLSKESPHQLALKIIAILPSRTQDIVRKRFGLDDDYPRTLEAVGQDYKITRERITFRIILLQGRKFILECKQE